MLSALHWLPARHLGKEVEAGGGEEVIFGSRIILLFPELQGKEEGVSVYFSFKATTGSGHEFGG